MTRFAIAFSSLVLASLALVGQAQAMVDDRDVARLVSFGGSCGKCDLSGRKLTGTRFTGAAFADAVFVGSDLRGSTFMGSNFQRVHMTGADLQPKGQSPLAANRAWVEVACPQCGGAA